MPEPTRDPRLLSAARLAEMQSSQDTISVFTASLYDVAHCDRGLLLAHIAAQDQRHAKLVEAATEIVAVAKRHSDFYDATLPPDYGYDDDIKWATLRRLAAALAALAQPPGDE